MKRTCRLNGALVIGVGLGLLALSGCEPDIPDDGPTPERVEAVFDPATSTIPLPNDLALSEGTLPELPGAGEESATGVFLEYLSGLTGWLSSTPIEIPFSGPLDEETLSEETVRLFRIEGDVLVELASTINYREVEGGGALVQVVPAEGLRSGDEYAAVVTKGVEGDNGLSVLEPLAIFYAASEAPLVDSDGDPALDVLADDPAQAQQLEGIRQFLAPVFEGLESRDDDPVARDEVAMLFRWSVSDDPVAVFNPETATVPLPNTAALDEDGTFPDAGTCFAGENSANGYFDGYLAGLSGWPDVTPITLPLNGPIDESSLTEDAVQLYRLDDGDWVRVEAIEVTYRTEAVDNCTGEVSEAYSLLIEYEGMEIRKEYFAFATRDLMSADGVALRPEIPMLMAMQPYPIVDEAGASLVSNFSDQQAQGLAGLQSILTPAMEFLREELELGHEDLASVWTWYTWNDTFVVFDPTQGQIPFPNAFLEEDGSVNIPIPADADSLTAGILATLNQRRGFSTTAPGWIPVDGLLDESTVTHNAVALAPEDGARTELLPEDAFSIDYKPSWGHIVIEPKRPLNANQLHAGIVTTEMLGANGRPVQPTAPFVFLRSPYPLVNSDGESLVYALDDATAVQLDEARASYSQLFLLAVIIDGARFSREQIASAWAFTTEDPAAQLLQLRAEAMYSVEARDEIRAFRSCETTTCVDDLNLVVFEEDEIEDPNNPGKLIDVSNLRAAQMVGEFLSLEYDQSIRAMTTTEVPVGLSVFLPRQEQTDGDCAAPFDVVIAQHGLWGTRVYAGLAQANELAAFPNCLATVSMDFPFHGGRALTAGDLHPASTPAENGSGFLTADLLASKENFVQGIIDLFILRRVIEGQEGVNGLENLFSESGGAGDVRGDIYGIGEVDTLFNDKVGYVGVSLGGILGVPFTGLDPKIDTAVINAAGGRLSWVLVGDDEGPSSIGGGILAAFESMGLLPGTFPFIQTMGFVQWIADVFDPFTIGPTAISGDRKTVGFDGEEFGDVTGASCVEDSECPTYWQCESEVCVEYLPPTQYLVQMAQGDRTIVNRATEALAVALEVELDDTTFDAPHSFMFTTDADAPGFAAGLCARLQAAAWLTSGFAGSAELTDELRAQNCLN